MYYDNPARRKATEQSGLCGKSRWEAQMGTGALQAACLSVGGSWYFRDHFWPGLVTPGSLPAEGWSAGVQLESSDGSQPACLSPPPRSPMS